MKKSIVVIETIMLAVIIILCAVAGLSERMADTSIIEQTEVQIEETPTAAKTYDVYIICDVESIEDNKVNVILPIGVMYAVDMPVDAPNYFTEVVIKTDNQDDYSTYKIVGLR